MKWDYIFLDFDPRTSLEDRIAVADAAIAMYKAGEEKRHLDTGTCEAHIYTKKEHGCSAGFSGQIFRAEVITNKGPSKHSILVCTQPPEWMNQNPNLN